LGLDAGNNRLYVGDAYYGSGKIVAINLTNNTFSTTLNFATGQNFPQIYDFGVPEQPKVTTTAAASVTATGATLAGTLVYGYGLSTERGVVYSSTNSTPTVSDTKAANATVTTNGAYSASVSGLTPVTTYYARAYAINGAGTTYGAVVTFTTISNDANLSAFTISSGTLTPVFAAGTTSYSASVTNATTSITVTPTRSQASATIKVNTVAVASGSASGNLSLAIGTNTISTVVTAQDASTKTYTLTVTRPKAAQTITFGAIAAKTFGNADFATGASTNSGLTISYVSSNTAVATIVSGQIHIVGAGTSTITASQAGDANYLAASDATQLLTVNKAAQAITFNALTARTYGNGDFAPGATAGSGLNVTYASDNTAVATIVSNQVHIVGQGTANITASQGGNTNYNAAANVVQILTVNKANLTITAAAKTKVYGDADPALTYSVTGVVGSDAATGALARAAGADAGTYAINQGTLSYGNNYNVTYNAANLTITKRPITLTAATQTKVYGNADPAFNQSVNVNAGSYASGDLPSDVFSRVAGENIGNYLFTLGAKKIKNGATDNTANYDITLLPSNFTITAKPITVTATGQTKTYGDADPALTYTTDVSLISGDSFAGALSRVAGENFGTYAINKNTLALSSNYTLTYVGANLTINKKAINVTATAKTKTYGDSDPTLTYTADALASGDSFSGAITRAAGESFGTYAIGQGTLAVSNAGNYTLNFTGANLTINKKTINVSAIAKSKTYGDSDPTLTFNADILVGGDSFTGAITRAPGESFGTYAITQGTLALSSNYTLNYTGANFSIGKRAIDIYSGSRDVQYGDPDGTIGYSYSGTPQGGDTFSGALSREPGTALGTYATTIGTFGITNGASYDLIFHSGLFNIVQREIIVSGGSTIKIYGDADPALNYSIVSGSLLGSTQITGGLSRDAGETAGAYNVTIGTLAINDANYKLTFQGGYFEVDRAPLTFTIANKTKVATKPNPALTYSLTGFKNGDTEATALNAPVQLTTDATISSAAGDYNIYANGGVFANNYNVNTTGGTLTVTPASTVNTLASATLNGGGFNEAFDPATDFYSVSIYNGSTSATLVANATDPLSTLSIGAYPAIATPYTSGTPYTIHFSNNNSEQVGVHVTAENGDIKSYYFNVAPIPSDSKLSNLDSGVGIISPSFNPLITAYTLNVSAETESVLITPTTHDPAAKARVNGGAGGGGEGGVVYGAKTVFLYEGSNHISINVKSADNTGNTFYTLTINRPITLAGLTLSAGTLSPAFDPSVTSYTAKVPESVPSVTITPSARQNFYQLLVNGEYVGNNTASTPITIGDGAPTVITTKITAGDGVSSKTYTINAVHASSNAGLASIALSTGALDPVFDAATATYNVYLPNSVTSLSFTPTLANANATMTVNASPATSGAAISINNLSVGLHNYYIVVTAEDGVVTETYTLSVTRALSSEPGLANLTLSHGTLSPAFNPTADPNYSVTLPAGVESVDITPVLIDTTAVLQARLNGRNLAIPNQHLITVPVNALYNTLTLTSTAQDGTTIAIYTITLERPTSTDNTLSGLTSSTGRFNQAFSSNRTFYQIVVPTDATNVILSPTAASSFATVKVNGVAVPRGYSSQSLPVSGPVNNYPVEVTAENGSVNTINVLVTKASTNANLFSIATNKGTLNPTFNKDVLNYTVIAGSTSSNAEITLAVADTTARMKLNGVSAQSYSPVLVSLAYGDNVETVVVTPQEGPTKTYTVTINRIDPSVATNLASVGIDAGPLTRIGTTDNYTATVPAAVQNVTVTATATDPTATISANNGSLDDPIALIVGNNRITLVVTAPDGSTKTHWITITRLAPSNNAVATLKISPNAELVSTTGGSTVNYVATVATDVTSVSIKATPQEEHATILINGRPIAGGVFSTPITLNADNSPTVINVVVTAQNGTTVRSYGVSVVKGASSNAYLNSITLNQGTPLELETSGPATTNYSSTVPYTAVTIKVTPKAQDSDATIKVDGTAVQSGKASESITLNPGAASTVIIVEVTAPNGNSKRTYSITLNRAPSTNAGLSDLALSAGTLNPVFTTGRLSYIAKVSNSAETVVVTPTAVNADATFTVNGTSADTTSPGVTVPLIVGANTVAILVTAPSGATKTYTVTITRLPSSNATLSAIKMSPGSTLVAAASGPADVNYTVSVSATTTSVTLTPKAQDAGATILVNGIETVATNTASSPILLNTDGSPTIINLQVTAANGTTVKTYSILVSRNGSSNTALTALLLNPNVPLTVVSSSNGAVNYAAEVSAGTTSVTLAATVQTSTAKIKINGSLVASGVPSRSYTLNGGTSPTDIVVVVTAPDKTTTRTYTVTITHAAPVLILAAKDNNKIDVLQKPVNTIEPIAEELVVKQAVSPNGDGINDRFTITGINAYPLNTVKVMNRNGDVIYEAKGYDNESKAFDGHASNGTLQQPGTYFYSVEYKKGDETKRKTGYIVIKY
jgi:gliding motility-associated-like protein